MTVAVVIARHWRGATQLNSWCDWDERERRETNLLDTEFTDTENRQGVK